MHGYWANIVPNLGWFQFEVDRWMQENQVTVQGRDVPRPVFEFNESGFPEVLVNMLYSSFERPTIIQSISWPIASSGRDIVSIAKTGSGKTLAVSLRDRQWFA